jgi:hypothetical protein
MLLALRTMLIVALVLAAAGPSLHRNAPLGRHAPAAMVLILDNSASSAAVVEGVTTLSELVRAAHRVIDRATPADRLWLMMTDGIARQGSKVELKARLEQVVATGLRLDVGTAVSQAQELILASGRRGEVVLVSDAQRSGLSPYRGESRVLMIRPAAAAPASRGIYQLSPRELPWGSVGGRVSVQVISGDSLGVPVSIKLPNGTVKDLLLTPGVAELVSVAGSPMGWSIMEATLPPDDFRLDDQLVTAVRVAPPAAVRWQRGSRFLDAALDVLSGENRITLGEGIRIGWPGPGPSVVLPPGDPARIGELNRQLAARGVSWRYGDLITAAGTLDSTTWMPSVTAVAQRYRLEPIRDERDILLTVGGEPWAVRSGNVLLVGSMLEPDWTDLPVSAAFVPWLDAMLTRAILGEPIVNQVVTGEAMTLPDRVTAIVDSFGTKPSEGGAPWRPTHAGIHWLMEGVDTAGVMQAIVDPRESALQRATPDEVVAVWPEAEVTTLEEGPERSFVATGRGDLRPLLLLIALGCVIGESILARGRRAS